MGSWGHWIATYWLGDEEVGVVLSKSFCLSVPQFLISTLRMLASFACQAAIRFKLVHARSKNLVYSKYSHQHPWEAEGGVPRRALGLKTASMGRRSKRSQSWGLLIHPSTMGAWEERVGFTPLSCSVISGMVHGPVES